MKRKMATTKTEKNRLNKQNKKAKKERLGIKSEGPEYDPELVGHHDEPFVPK